MNSDARDEYWMLNDFQMSQPQTGKQVKHAFENRERIKIGFYHVYHIWSGKYSKQYRNLLS